MDMSGGLQRSVESILANSGRQRSWIIESPAAMVGTGEGGGDAL